MCIVPSRAASCLLTGEKRQAALQTLVDRHYLHRLPAGKSHVFGFGGAIVMLSCSANIHAARFLLGESSLRLRTWNRGRLPKITNCWVYPAFGRWRARPYWRVASCRYRDVHLGYFDTRNEAVRICGRWKRLCESHGPLESARLVKRRHAVVWELSRLWAPERHAANLLTQAISRAVAEFRLIEPDVQALVTYADPEQGHIGTVYRAASWHPCGLTSRSRYYVDSAGRFVAERGRSDATRLTVRQLAARGWTERRGERKLRFAFGLTRQAKRIIERRFPNARILAA